MNKRDKTLNLIAKLEVKLAKNPFDEEIKETLIFLKSLIREYILVSKEHLKELIQTKTNETYFPKFCCKKGDKTVFETELAFERINSLSLNSKYLMFDKPEDTEIELIDKALTKQIFIELEREVNPNEKETIDLLNNNSSTK